MSVSCRRATAVDETTPTPDAPIGSQQGLSPSLVARERLFGRLGARHGPVAFLAAGAPLLLDGSLATRTEAVRLQLRVHLAAPAVHLDDFQRRAKVELLVEEAGELADRHPVAHRNGKQPDERFVSRQEPRAFDVDPVDRVRPVADDHGNAVPAARAQAIRHRVDVGIDARADVLQVDHHGVDVAQHLGGRLARLAVERVDRDAPARIARVRRLDHVVLQVRAEAVLGAEQGREVDVRVVEQDRHVGPGQAEVGSLALLPRRPLQELGAVEGAEPFFGDPPHLQDEIVVVEDAPIDVGDAGDAER